MAVTLLGNEPELHDRLAGRAGDFAAVEAELPRADHVTVAARRANAFHLAAITQFAVHARGGAVTAAPFDAHPARTLDQRFDEHLRELNRLAEPWGIRITVDDPLLRPLFAHVAPQVTADNEVDLLRLLGIVCDTALIGPHWFVFEIINVCNAHCRYCNIHAPNRRPGRDFLDVRLPYEHFVRTVDDLARLGTDGVTLLANGEPTLHPDFARMALYAKSRGLRVNFFTNGLQLDEAKARVVVEAGVDEMFCTISAASSRVYADLHADVVPEDWGRLQHNLRHLFSLRRASGHAAPTAWMVNVICGPNVQELPAMVELAAELGFDGIRPQLLRVDDYNRELALTADDIRRLQTQFDGVAARCRALGLQLWDGFAFQLQHAGDDPDAWSGDEFVDNGCFVGFALGLAKSNGDLSFCCTVKPVANLAEGPFAQLWTGGLYHRARLAAKHLRAARDLPLRDGARLYTDACHHCDNHDINRRIHDQLTLYDMWRFLG